MSKFIIFSEYGELLDLAIHLQDVEKQEVVMHIPDHDYVTIGDGIIPKEKNWWNCLGQGYIWCFDGCAYGNLQDWLRSKGEVVFGGSEKGDKLENNRQLSQEWFKKAGFQQPKSQNFKTIDDALKFVQKHKDQRWILKQNGNAPKSINHMGKFDGSEDLIFHLEEMKNKWNEAQFGKFDCDLMEVVEGLECAVSVFFNGTDFMKNKDGKVVGYLNFEEKKETDGGTGETTGEMGTTFIGVTEDNTLFRDIIMRPKILEVLRSTKFRGIFDINCIKTKEGIVALEPTCRFGIPATSYEFMEGLVTPTHQLLEMVAKGEDTPIEVHEGIGMVMCVVAKPYPIESDVSPESTSVGEKLWILQDGEVMPNFSEDQMQHIHLENFMKDGKDYRVATSNGYLLTVTGRGKTISEARESLIQYIKDNLYLSGMKYRTDIGVRVEEHYGITPAEKYKQEADKKVKDMEESHKKELSDIKSALRKAVYE